MNRQRTQSEFVSGAVADADYITGNLMSALSDCELSYITFYSDADLTTQVTPSAGVVDVTLSPDGVTYRTLTDGSFLATDAYEADRTSPVGYGLSTHGKITLTGVVGASHFKACFYKV